MFRYGRHAQQRKHWLSEVKTSSRHMTVIHTRDRMMNECPTTFFVSEMICSFGCDLHVMRAFSAADWIEMENRKGGDIWQGYYSVILSVKFHLKWFT